MIHDIIDVVEAQHDINITVGISKCIEAYAASAGDVVGFGKTLDLGHWHHTVYVRDGNQTRQLFFDPTTMHVKEVVK